MRLVDLDALQAKIHGPERPEIYDGMDKVFWIEKCFEAAPTVDAEPVRHGRWINLQSAECSECGHVFPAFMLFQHYCPNCGAQMDKEDS